MPLVSRTPAIEEFIARNLAERAREVVSRVPRDLLARTAAFLLLEDAKSSYVIEGERPPQDRIQRWGRAIGEAGRTPLSLDELLRVQRIVIGDSDSCASACAAKVASSAYMIAKRTRPSPIISAPVPRTFRRS